MSQTNNEHDDINVNLEKTGKKLDLGECGHRHREEMEIHNGHHHRDEIEMHMGHHHRDGIEMHDGHHHHRDDKEIHIERCFQNFFPENAMIGMLEGIPRAGIAGRFFYVVAGEKAEYLYFDDGRAWNVVNVRHLSDLLGDLDSIDDGKAFKKVAAADITDGHVNKVSDGENTKTALEIKSHIEDAEIHRSINDNGLTAIDLWSAQKIQNEITNTRTYLENFDNIHDGAAYKKVVAADITDGHVNKVSDGVNTKTASEIKSHIEDVEIHRSIDDKGLETTDLWSAHKIQSELTNTRIYLEDLDNIHDGTAFKKVSAGDITGGHVNKVSDGVNTKTALEIKSHIDAAEIHRSIDDKGSSTTDLWSAHKVQSELTNTRIYLEDLDNIHDGTAFKKVAACDVTGGHVNKVSDGVNTKTALEIKSHIDTAEIHRSIDDNGSATTDLWSAQKIQSELANTCTYLQNLDNIHDGTSFKKVAAVDITDGHVNKVSDGVNSKTALEIKSHIDATEIHRSINDNGSAAIDLWSAMKIKKEIADAVSAYKSTYDVDGDGKVDHAREADTVNWSGIMNKPSEYLPTAHSKSHAYGGPDAITPQDINAMPKGPITWNQLKGI